MGAEDFEVFKVLKKEAQQRKNRRVDKFNNEIENLSIHCTNKNIRFISGNDHWRFYTSKNGVIEFWPSSGKLVINRDYKNYKRIFAYIHLLKQIDKLLMLENK